jgi:hypothetical protein
VTTQKIPPYFAKMLDPLIGMTVEGIVAVDMTDDDDFEEIAYGLALKDKTGKVTFVFPMRDEEGNGPGCLAVESDG